MGLFCKVSNQSCSTFCRSQANTEIQMALPLYLSSLKWAFLHRLTILGPEISMRGFNQEFEDIYRVIQEQIKSLYCLKLVER